jgi:APA family basic amino acid/polyamine antiporter
MKKVLKFLDVYFVGLGYIVGAGIYSLLYLITQYGGNFTWLSFIIGGIISLLTGLSYSNLTKHFNSNATEYDYVSNLISNKLNIPLGFTLIFKGILTISTLLISFSNIVFKEYSINKPLIIIITSLIAFLLNIYSTQLTTNVNMGISITESSTLILLILFGFKYIKFNQMFTSKINVNGIIQGAFLTLFAYSGFESLPKLSEETINSTEVIPKSIVYSILTTIVLYSLVSITTNSVLGTNNVSNNVNPITKAFETLFGPKINPILNGITLMSIFNIIMITILVTSRQLHSIDNKRSILSYIEPKTQTPIVSISFVLITAIALCIFGSNINKTTYGTNLAIFIIFALVNYCSIILNKKNNKSIPYYSYGGLISSIIILIHGFITPI